MSFSVNVVKGKIENLVAPQQLTLEQIEKDCWEFLLQGSLKGKDAFHTFALGTCHNGEIEMRTLVLRKVEKAEKRIFTHTDARSPKVKQLEGNSLVGLLFYDPARKIQMRIKAEPVLHHNDLDAQILWNETRLSSRKSYLSTKAPGQTIGHGEDSLPAHLIGRDPDLEESNAGRINFMALSFEVKQIDWLYLHSQGHRRAIFQYNGEGFDAYWINP